MSFRYIQDYYKVPACEGRRVEYTGDLFPKQGVIVGVRGHYIRIHFDGEKHSKGVFHPTWKIEYLEMGKVPKISRGRARYMRFLEMDGVFESFRAFLAFEQEERESRRLGFSSVYDYYKWLKTIY